MLKPLIYPTPLRPIKATLDAGTEHFSWIWLSNVPRSMKSKSRRKETLHDELGGVSDLAKNSKCHQFLFTKCDTKLLLTMTCPNNEHCESSEILNMTQHEIDINMNKTRTNYIRITWNVTGDYALVIRNRAKKLFRACKYWCCIIGHYMIEGLKKVSAKGFSLGGSRNRTTFKGSAQGFQNA